MTVRTPILAALVVAVLVLPVVASARRLASTDSQLRSMQASLQQTAAATGRVLTLRGRQQRIAERKRPQQDVIARVNVALTNAEISDSRFAGLRPHSDSALPGADGGPPYRRQTVSVRLRQLSVAELGAFLEAWARSGDIWTPTQIELAHVHAAADAARYDVSMLFSAMYVADRGVP